MFCWIPKGQEIPFYLGETNRLAGGRTITAVFGFQNKMSSDATAGQLRGKIIPLQITSWLSGANDAGRHRATFLIPSLIRSQPRHARPQDIGAAVEEIITVKAVADSSTVNQIGDANGTVMPLSTATLGQLQVKRRSERGRSAALRTYAPHH